MLGHWGGPRGVHNQAVQLPPGHIRHELFLSAPVGTQGGAGLGGGRCGQGLTGPTPAPLPGQGLTLGPAAHSESCVCHCAPGAGSILPSTPPGLLLGLPSFGHMSVPQRDGLWGTRAWPGSTPVLGLLPHLAAPCWPLEGANTVCWAKAPEPVRAPHRAPFLPGEDQAAEGFTAEAHAPHSQANCLRTCRLNGSGLGSVLEVKTPHQSFSQHRGGGAGGGAGSLAWHYHSSWGLSTPQPRPAAPAGSPQT